MCFNLKCHNDVLIIGLPEPWLVAPSLGAIDVTVSSNKASIAVGEMATISLIAMSTSVGVSGIAAMGGSITGASTDVGGLGDLSSDGFAWVPTFFSPTFPGVTGTSLAKGSWGNFGSGQTAFPPSNLYGKLAPVVLATYTVTGVSPGVVTLSSPRPPSVASQARPRPTKPSSWARAARFSSP